MCPATTASAQTAGQAPPRPPLLSTSSLPLTSACTRSSYAPLRAPCSPAVPDLRAPHWPEAQAPSCQGSLTPFPTDPDPCYTHTSICGSLQHPHTVHRAPLPRAPSLTSTSRCVATLSYKAHSEVICALKQLPCCHAAGRDPRTAGPSIGSFQKLVTLSPFPPAFPTPPPSPRSPECTWAFALAGLFPPSPRSFHSWPWLCWHVLCSWTLRQSSSRPSRPAQLSAGDLPSSTSHGGPRGDPG